MHASPVGETMRMRFGAPDTLAREKAFYFIPLVAVGKCHVNKLSVLFMYNNHIAGNVSFFLYPPEDDLYIWFQSTLLVKMHEKLLHRGLRD